MMRIKQKLRHPRIAGAVFLLLCIIVGRMAMVLAQHFILPDYFSYPLKPGEHLRCVSQNGKSNVYLVDAADQQQLVGELRNGAEIRYTLVESSLEFGCIAMAIFPFFVAWPRQAHNPSAAYSERR